MNVTGAMAAEQPRSLWKQTVFLVVVIGSGVAVGVVAGSGLHRDQQAPANPGPSAARPSAQAGAAPAPRVEPVPLPGMEEAPPTAAEHPTGSLAWSPTAAHRASLLSLGVNPDRAVPPPHVPAPHVTAMPALPHHARVHVSPSPPMPEPMPHDAAMIQPGIVPERGFRMVSDGVWQATDPADLGPATGVLPLPQLTAPIAVDAGALAADRAEGVGTHVPAPGDCAEGPAGPIPDAAAPGVPDVAIGLPAAPPEAAATWPPAPAPAPPLVNPEGLRDVAAGATVASPLTGPAGAGRPPLPDCEAAPGDDPQCVTPVPPPAAAAAPAAEAVPSASLPCKIGIDLPGRGAASLDVHLLAGGEPAVHLGNLLDLFARDLPTHDFVRLRTSPNAQTLIGLTELARSGFEIGLTGDRLSLALRG